MKNSTKVDANKVVNNVTVNVTKPTTKVVSIEKTVKVPKIKIEKVVNPINFKSTQVFNKEFSKDNLSLGKIRANILTFNDTLKNEEKLNVLNVELLVKMKIQKNYIFIQSKVTANKKGFYSSYKLLMFFRKNLTMIQDEFNK
jgi:hypothetical protein